MAMDEESFEAIACAIAQIAVIVERQADLDTLLAKVEVWMRRKKGDSEGCPSCGRPF
jgi:hypothetical protein